MSQSTNAILAFGFDLGEVDEGAGSFFRDNEVLEEPEFDEWVAFRAGVTYPRNHSGIDSPEYKSYTTRRDAAIAACPVDVIEHCSGEYPMLFLAIRDTKLVARRGYPEAFALVDPAQEKIDAMRAFCTEHGIEWKDPSWHLFSMWN